MQQNLRLRWTSDQLAPHLRTGRLGEKTAERYLQRKGYRVMSKNVRIQSDEIDIIVFDPTDRVIAFCEVKTRDKDDPDYRPDLNVTPDKRQHIIRAARRWVSEHGWTGGYRVDLVYVAAGRVIDHVQEMNWE